MALVSAGAEVNEPDQIGCTPLHYAAASQAFSRWVSPARAGHPPPPTPALTLVVRVPSPQSGPPFSWEPREQRGGGEGVLLVSPGLICCENLTVGQRAETLLLISSCLEHLLDNGADPSMVNSKGYSAVHYAAYHGNKQNLELVSIPCLLCGR